MVLFVCEIFVNFTLIMVQQDFFINQLLVLWNFETIQFKIEVEIGHRVTCRLVINKMKLVHIGMGQSLFYCNSLCWVKSKHFLNQIDGLWILSTLKHFVEVFSPSTWQLLHKSSIVNVFDCFNKLSIWLSNEIGYHHHLFLLTLRW